MPSVKHITPPLLFALGLSSCYWGWHDVDYDARVHAVGEVRDGQNRLAQGLEVRLIKHWPVEGDDIIEPPASVLFADEPTAPEGADYRVQLVAVATTDAEGWFDMWLNGEAIKDPRYEEDEYGRIVPAYTMVVVRDPNNPDAGTYSYSWRFSSRYLHHCELLTLDALEATIDFDRVPTEGLVDFDFPRVVQKLRERHRNVVEYRVSVGPGSEGTRFSADCRDDDGELSGCSEVPGDPNRLRISLQASTLREYYAGADGTLDATLIAAGRIHRAFGAFSGGDDPTWGGAFPGGPNDPNDPGDPNDPNNPGDPNDPGDPNNPGDPNDPNDPNNPGDPNDPGDPNNPGMPGRLALPGVWAVGPDEQFDLTGTAARDGDALTRYDFDGADVRAIYVYLDDVRLTEAGILNTLVGDAENNCIVVQYSPTVYNNLEAAISGIDWVGTARFCGSTGALNEVSVIQAFTTSNADGKRAGWFRVVAAPGDDLQIRAIGEVVAFGWK